MPLPPQMRDFTSPAFGRGAVRMAIARKDATNRSQYMLTLALSFGMVDDLRLATLNRSTTADQQPSMSPSGHPIILLDCTFNPVPEVPGGLLTILLQAEPAVIRLTGNTRKVITDTGAATLLPEVEILMGEDDLAHTCCYCGDVEFIEPCRFRRCDDSPATPQYICPACDQQTVLGRKIRWVLRRYWLGGLGPVP